MSSLEQEPIQPPQAPLFPQALIKQEMSPKQYIDIPEEIKDINRLWRPAPLYRAHRLEKALGTPAKIYYKYEGVSPAGSHKPNTSIAQAYYNIKEGVERITTETGAGQWDSALGVVHFHLHVITLIWSVRSTWYVQVLNKNHTANH